MSSRRWRRSRPTRSRPTSRPSHAKRSRSPSALQPLKPNPSPMEPTMVPDETQPDPTEEVQEPPPEEEKPEGEEPAQEGEEKPEGEEGEEGEGTEEKPAEAKADGTEAQDKRKRAGGWQRRIEKQERELAFLREQVQRQGTPVPPSPPKEKSAEEKTQDYIKAIAREALEEEARQRRAQTVLADFQRRTQEYAAKNPDFEDVVPGVNVPADSAIGQALLTSECPGEILHLFANDKAELARISALPDVAAIREI